MGKRYTIGICDDEKIWLNQITALCSQTCSMLHICADLIPFSSGKEVLQYQPPLDILFLDEEMPLLSGQKVKEIFDMESRETMIVFITCHSEILYDAFGRNVYGFLHKPLDASAFKALMQKMLNRLTSFSFLEIPDTNSLYRRLPYDTILYIKAAGSYSTLVLKNGETITLRKGLSRLEADIDYRYMLRIHKSYMVNLRQPCTLHPADLTVIMANHTVLPISRRRKKSVCDLYTEIISERMNHLCYISPENSITF